MGAEDFRVRIWSAAPLQAAEQSLASWPGNISGELAEQMVRAFHDADRAALAADILCAMVLQEQLARAPGRWRAAALTLRNRTTRWRARTPP